MIIKNNRSVRRFYESFPIPMETLRGFVEAARFCPSAANLQPLRYIISNDTNTNEKIFKTLAWAAYLTDWPGPEEGERPSAYIVILGDKRISKNFSCDHGISAQTIMLCSREIGFGGCIIASIKKDELRHNLNINENYEILLVLALGKPKEEILTVDIDEGQSIKYYRDERGVHHVPKRKLDDIIVSL